MAKLEEGCFYYNPWQEKKFKIIELDKKNDRVILEWEETGKTIESSYKNILKMVNYTIKNEMKGFEQNLNVNNKWNSFIKNTDSNINNIFKGIKDIYSNDPPPEWIDSENLWFYKIIGNSTKGKFARMLYLGFMEKLSHSVQKDKGEYVRTKGYHGIVNGRKKLIKVATMKDNEVTSWNNFRQFQEWDDIVFICIFPNHIEIYETSKEKFMEYVKENDNEVMWAGGKEKRERLNDDINKNDYFHWNRMYPMPNMLEQIC